MILVWDIEQNIVIFSLIDWKGVPATVLSIVRFQSLELTHQATLPL